MPRPADRHRIYAGDRVRDVRARYGYSQATMAQRLGISISYLSQIESGDRPLTAAVVSALSRSFPLDWSDVTPEDGSALFVAALEAGTDPSIPSARLPDDAVVRGVKQQPLLTRRMIALHAAFRRSQDQLRVLDDRVETGSRDGAHLPWEEVRDWFQSTNNYIDSLDRCAEEVAGRLRLGGNPLPALTRCLIEAHGVHLVEETADGASDLRRFDHARSEVVIGAHQPVETQSFQLAHQLMQFEARDVMDQLVAKAPLRSEAARSLLLVGLANYAAGALLMPYGRFRAEAKRLRHDIDALRHLFSVSFEQACHRLSTLQRPAQQGVPFFFCRVDMAGNVTKRHSATRLQFAQFGGTCPLMVVHEAVAIPDRIFTQLAETPDGTRYVSIAKGLTKPTTSFRRPARRYALALGCEVEHAALFVYADRLDLTGQGSATPIGPSCRICPRHDCDQRAYPPAGRDLQVDPDTRSIIPYTFR